ncbi:MAG TPA: PilZ domain-containing protein [Terriglobales bacterium]
MSLRALVLCSDDKILRVLRRVLSDLEIDAELCANSDAAARRLTRQRFEAVVVDCEDEDTAATVLKTVRRAPCNVHAVAVAILDAGKAVKSGFAMGAHFVLYKPLTAERAKSSFRAVRALMKCERRRNARVPIELPVALEFAGSEGQQKATSIDLSEGGMATRFARRSRKKDQLRVSFALPGDPAQIECKAEMAWEDDGARAGIRFVDMQPEDRNRLRAWLAAHSPEIESDDPPVGCKLTDLSPGACYVEIGTPFPMRTRVTLAMPNGDRRLEVEGLVRVTHPEAGMGIEFARATDRQKENLERLIQALISSKEAPGLEVRPEGLEDAAANSSDYRMGTDPLLDLFHSRHQLTTEAFVGELRKQRAGQSMAAEA